jgi:hypothetical protein
MDLDPKTEAACIEIRDKLVAAGAAPGDIQFSIKPVLVDGKKANFISASVMVHSKA